MVRTCENDLICDFAETYQVFDYREIPARKAAILAAGLRKNSRSKMKLSGEKYELSELFLAMIIDRLSVLVWQRTEDGAKGRKRPESIYNSMMGFSNKEETSRFETPEEFEQKRKEIMERR